MKIFKELKELSGSALLSLLLAFFPIYYFFNSPACCFHNDMVEIILLASPLLAILFGIISLHNIKRNNHRGRSLAASAIVIGSLETIFFAFLVISYYYPFLF